MIVFLQSGYNRVKVIVVGQKWLYFEKMVVFGQKRLYSGKIG